MNSISFRNGYAAYLSGKSKHDNPNTTSPQEWHEWERGYLAAKTEKR